MSDYDRKPPPPDWRRATLGDAATAGDPITVWCNNRACGSWQEHGRQYRAVLSPTDLAAYAERYGAANAFADFRPHLRCRYCGSGDVSTIVESHHETPLERWISGGADQGDAG
jgi:hypothetical protein